MNHAANSLSGFIFAFFSTITLVPIIKSLSIKYKIVDKPEERKQHKSSIVRLGGLGIFLGFYISLLILKVFSWIALFDLFTVCFKNTHIMIHC